MALVFKIKFQDTLRRWVVCESWDETSFSLGIQDLELKIRELFRISSAAPITITYVDKEEDVVTLADDQDLLDACLVQRLNPLRMSVRRRDESSEVCFRSSVATREPGKDSMAEAFLKACFPHSTSDAIEQFLRKYPQVVDMTMPAAELMNNVQLLKNLSGNDAPAACDGLQATSTRSESACHDLSKRPSAHEPALESRRKSDTSKVFSPRIFHRGVQCDGCGMIPIEGPRYKSMKLYDYDLCSSCFEATGNDTDFQRVDVPVYPAIHGHGFCPARWSMQHMASSVRPSFARGPYGWVPECPVREQGPNHCPSSQAGGKLDASFVKDVTVFDGTEVAPRAKITKIWRLRNVGTIPWPHKTQLVRMGGTSLSSQEAVNLELPEGGLPCGAHIDASVDLIAPEELGQYASHWRLMSPEGKKFGHRIWVVINVVNQAVESKLIEPSRLEETSNGENETVTLEIEKTEDGQMSESGEGREILSSAPSNNPMTSPSNQPMASDSDERKEKFASDTQKSEDFRTPEIATDELNRKLETQNSEDLLTPENFTDEFCGTSVEQENKKDKSGKESFGTVYEESVVSERKELREDSSSMIDNEVDGFSVVGKPTENARWYNTHQGSPDSMQTVLIQEQSTENVTVESTKTEQEMLLQLLESMGFLDMALNADLLEKNNQDLLLTLDDLVEVARWDNMLKDLQEMGFNDKLMNCRLLLENQGSMKRAVKDLVEMEKKKAGWQEVLTI